jgi:hypothetical protein
VYLLRRGIHASKGNLISVGQRTDIRFDEPFGKPSIKRNAVGVVLSETTAIKVSETRQHILEQYHERVTLMKN